MTRRIDPPEVRHAVAQRVLATTRSDPQSQTRPITVAAERLHVCRATFWRWRRPAQLQGQPGRPPIDTAGQLDDAVKGLYFCTGGNAARTHRDLAKEQRITYSVRTLQRRVAAIPPAEKIFGLKGEAAMRHETYTRLPFVGAEQRNDLWQLDNRHLDIELVSRRGQIIRPWSVSMMDVATGAVVGYCLCEATPTSTDLAMATASGILPAPDEANPFHGVPKRVLIDNGADYLSEHYQQILQRLGIAVTICPAYTPQAKGKVERWHRTMDQFGLSGLPGDLKGPRNADGTLRLDGRALLSFDNFAVIFAGVVDHQNGTNGSDLEVTPTERWNADLGLIVDMSASDLAPALLREDTREVGRGGVRVAMDHGSRFYSAPEIANMNGKTVKIGYLPHDESRLWLYELDGTLLCVATPLDEWHDEERTEFLKKRSAEAAQSRRAVRAARAAARAGFPTYTLPSLYEDGLRRGFEVFTTSSRQASGSPVAESDGGDAESSQERVSAEAGRPRRKAGSRGRRATPAGLARQGDEIERLAFGLEEDDSR
jgi:transposase InsO family protein